MRSATLAPADGAMMDGDGRVDVLRASSPEEREMDEESLLAAAAIAIALDFPPFPGPSLLFWEEGEGFLVKNRNCGADKEDSKENTSPCRLMSFIQWRRTLF